MAVTDHIFSWVDVYVACVQAKVYDTPFSIFQDVKKLDNFTMIQNKHKGMKNIMNLLERAVNNYVGFDK